MKKRLGILIAFAFLLVAIVSVGFISATSPAVCKDADGYYNDCGIVYGYSHDYGYSNNYVYPDTIHLGYYSDYGHYDYGKLANCRNSRGENYLCYKQYNDYETYDENYYDYYHNYYFYNYGNYQEYRDCYGNSIKISRPGYYRYYGGYYDYQDDPCYPDGYMQANLQNQQTQPPTIYIG